MNFNRVFAIAFSILFAAQVSMAQDTALSVDENGGIKIGPGNMEITSTATDNFQIKTNTSTPNPNFTLGIGDGAGGWLHQPIMWNHSLILNGSGNSWCPSCGVPVSDKNRADMVITGEGKVGIGVPHPGGRFEVGLNEAFSGKLIRAIGHSNETDAANIEVGDGGTIYWRLLRLSSNTFQTKMSGPWAIHGGNIGIGAANPTEKLHVVGKVKSTGGFVRDSDERLKQNIKLIEDPLEKISAIKGVSYEWINSPVDEKEDVGVIAQDVEKIFPEMVLTDSDGYKSVDYAKLVAPLIEAVKILKKQNEDLKIGNESLKEENSSIKSKCQNIERRLSDIEYLLNSLGPIN